MGAVLLAIAGTAIFLVIAYKRLGDQDPSQFVFFVREPGTVKFRFTLHNIVVATHDFSEHFCIGRGGSGTVYKANLSEGRIIFA